MSKNYQAPKQFYAASGQIERHDDENCFRAVYFDQDGSIVNVIDHESLWVLREILTGGEPAYKRCPARSHV